LISLENLLEKNLDELLRNGFSMRLNQVFTYLDKLKDFYSSTFNRRIDAVKKNKFEIEKIKAHSKKLPSFNEKKAYLLRQKTDFLQEYKDKARPPFDEQIDLELNYLNAELKLLRDSGKGLEEENYTMIWNGQVQQLVEVFFDCLHQTNEEGQPLLKVSNEKVIRFIIRNFKRTDDSSFSAGSIRSFLRPSRQKKKSQSNQKKKNDE